MNTDPSSPPEITDDDYLLWQKWSYNQALLSGSTQSEPVFNDNDHTLMYKVSDSLYAQSDA